MTDNVSKQHLVAAIDQVREGLKLVEPMCDVLYSATGDGYALGTNQGAQHVLDKLAEALNTGFYDAEDSGEIEMEVLFLYDEEDLDTNTEESYPEEDGQQDEADDEGGVYLDPNTTPEERAELVEFYNSIGIKVH